MANKLLTINLRKYLVNQPRTKRIRKAVRYIREQVARHSKTNIENVRLSTELNALIFKSAAKRMTPLKLNISIENNIAKASPFKEVQAPAAEKAQEKGKNPAGTKSAKEKNATTQDKAKPNK
ncbi:MAG: hypothetical protein QXW10_02830 [Candidatus Micrarchaeaceae archaeon]